ncbi:MAG: AAA family ATPase, partial [Clostridia bacterium]|nr:AAA family ATPase [Clostridia bacterium]
MRIDKLTITEFGALKDRIFSLKDGINVFEGRNESGKSTVVSFIRFMLYGMPKKTASSELTERDRGLSWDNLTASGSMELTVDGERYRIERTFRLTGNTSKDIIDECKIIDLATGSEVFEGEIPGKHFLNISADVYDSTSCVRQLECTHIDGNSVRTSIENLLLSADEKIDTKKAQTKLDSFRKVLLHKNAKGGRLYELEAEKAILDEKFRQAKEDADVIIAKENAVANLSEAETKHAKDERDTSRDIKTYETCVILKRFGELHAEEEKIYGLQNDLKELTETRGFFGKLPERQLLDELDASERELSRSADVLTVAQGEHANAEASPCGDRIMAAIYEKVVQSGKKQSILAKVNALIRKRKGALVAAVVFYILGGILLLAGSVGLASPFIPIDLDAILNLIPATLRTYILAAVAAVGAGFIVLGVTRSVAGSKKKKERIALFADFGLNSKTAMPEELDAHMDKCEESYILCRRHDDAYEAATIKLNAASAELSGATERAISLFESIDTHTEDKSPAALAELLRARRMDLTEVCAIKEKLVLELESHRNAAHSIKASLDDYNESKLRGEIPTGTDIIGIAENTDIVDLKKRNEFAKSQYNAAMQKRIGIEKELIALNATAENPAKLATKLGEICRELEESKQNYDALMMAISAIDTASDNIRKNN